MTRTFSRKLTLYSFLCTMAVVLAHYKVAGDIPFRPRPGWDTLVWERSDAAFEAGITLAMQFFFFKSAFLLYRDAAPDNISRKIKSRLYSLGLPLLVWNAAKLVMRLFFGQAAPVTGIGSLVRGFTYDPYDGPTWYLTTMLLFLLLVPVLGRIKNKGAVLLLIPVLYRLPRVLPAPFAQDAAFALFWQRCFAYWPEYLLGFLLARLCPEPILREKYPQRPVSLAAVLLFAVWLSQARGLFPLPLALPRPILALLDLLMPAVLWLTLDSTVLKRDPPFALDISFLLYVSHELVIVALGRFLPPLLVRSGVVLCGWQALALRLGQTALLYGIVLLMAATGRRFLPPRWFAAVSGGRVRERTPATQ